MASKLRSQIHKDFRRASRTNSLNTQSNMDGTAGRTTSGINNSTDSEQSPLLDRTVNTLKAPASGLRGRLESARNNPHAYISYPANFLYLTYEILVSNYANVFLVFVPLGIVAGALDWDPTWIFILNFLAIVPLAGLLAFATEELAAKLGQTIGGLLNATFGNAVELIVSIIALKEGQIRIVQASMLGSILSNILLVLGCCFIAGGIKRQQQEFDVTVAQTMASLLAVASASLIIPATLYAAIADADPRGERPGLTNPDILLVSRGTSIILLVLYILYLYFQLKSHANLFDEEADKASPDDITAESAIATDDAANESKEGDTLSPVAAGIALVLITILVAICAEYLVDSIDAIVQRAHISKTFIGLILLPIVGNAAEHVTAVVVSYKNKMNLALGVAVGSSLQIALFVTPFLVCLGWAIERPMTLRFETFEVVVFFISVLVVNYLIGDGRSNYLEGAMCIGVYLIIALAFYVYPDTPNTRDGPPNGLGVNLISTYASPHTQGMR